MIYRSFFLPCILLLPLAGFTQAWQQVDDFPGTQRDDGASFVIGNVAYCGTGNLPSGTGTIDFYALDMTTDVWTTVASLPAGEERQYACGFSNATHGFVFGGYNAGNFLGDLWQYDPLLNSWTEKTPLPAVGRSASVCFVLDDTAYFVCGKTAADYAIDEVWAYTMTTDSWEQKNDFPFGNRWRAAGASSATKGYLVLGKDESLAYPEGLYEYDAPTDSWTELTPFPNAGRTHAKMVFFDDDLLLLTGWDSLGASYSDMWRYDIAGDAWDQLSPIPAAGRRGGMCFSNAVYVYYTAGIDASNVRIKETWKNINPTYIEENETKNGPLIFPNPASSEITIVTNAFTNQPIRLFIYNLAGELLLSKETKAFDKTELGELAAGTYIVVLYSGNQFIQEKLIVLPD